MRRVSRTTARRRSNAWFRTLLVGLIAALSMTALPATAAMIAKTAGAPAAVRSDSHCDYRVSAPLPGGEHYIVSTTSFRCTTHQPNASVTVVMQARSGGHWHTVASATKHLDAQASTKHTVRAKWRTAPVACGSPPPTKEMRTHFTLTLSGRLTIDYTTPGVHTGLPCSSPQPLPLPCPDPSGCGPSPHAASSRFPARPHLRR